MNLTYVSTFFHLIYRKIFLTNYWVCYQLKNQATVGKQGRAACGRRVRGSESPQRKQFYQTKQRWNWGNGHYYGSGMRAVFLGGSGSSNGSGGTGVFLPRGSSVSAGYNKRSGNFLIFNMVPQLFGK